MASTKEVSSVNKKLYSSDGNLKEKEAMLSDNGTKKSAVLSDAEIKSKKRRILKNITVINISFFLMWSGFVGLSIIQSSIVGDIGTISLGINFGCSIFACVIFGPLLIRLLGTKWTMFACFAGFCTWMAYNFYPVWETAIPAAVINGLSNGPIWTAQSTYFTICGLEYAKLTNEREDVVIARFFGIFFCMVLIGKFISTPITDIFRIFILFYVMKA